MRHSFESFDLGHRIFPLFLIQRWSLNMLACTPFKYHFLLHFYTFAFKFSLQLKREISWASAFYLSKVVVFLGTHFMRILHLFLFLFIFHLDHCISTDESRIHSCANQQGESTFPFSTPFPLSSSNVQEIFTPIPISTVNTKDIVRCVEMAQILVPTKDIGNEEERLLKKKIRVIFRVSSRMTHLLSR